MTSAAQPTSHSYDMGVAEDCRQRRDSLRLGSPASEHPADVLEIQLLSVQIVHKAGREDAVVANRKRQHPG